MPWDWVFTQPMDQSPVAAPYSPLSVIDSASPLAAAAEPAAMLAVTVAVMPGTPAVPGVNDIDRTSASPLAMATGPAENDRRIMRLIPIQTQVQAAQTPA